MAGEIDIGKVSNWNEGALQMLRFHELQKEINECNTNPLAFNGDRNLYNYEIILHNNNSLFSEASPKFKDKEKALGLLRKKMIESFLESNPIHINKPNLNHEVETMFSNPNWLRLRMMLFEYNLYVRGLLDAHKLTSPDKSDPSRAVIDM